MSAAVLAWNTRNLEKDATSVASVLVDCPGCDPDNPRSVPRDECAKCRGTGKIPTSAGVVTSEIHASRLQLLRGEKDQPDFDD